MKRQVLVSIIFLSLLLATACVSNSPPVGRSMRTVKMLTTAYCPCQKCCAWTRNWYGKPVFTSGPLKGKRKIIGMTADGTMGKHGTIAADTRFYPMGTQMYIPGYGYGTVHDRGGKIKGADHIDLYFKKHKKALEWGRQILDVKIYN